MANWFGLNRAGLVLIGALKFVHSISSALWPRSPCPCPGAAVFGRVARRLCRVRAGCSYSARQCWSALASCCLADAAAAVVSPQRCPSLSVPLQPPPCRCAMRSAGPVPWRPSLVDVALTPPLVLPTTGRSHCRRGMTVWPPSSAVMATFPYHALL